MRPRTKLQKEIFDLSNRLPAIGTKVTDWAKEKAVCHNGYRTKKSIYCTECGKNFDNIGVKDGKNEVCPHCGTKLIITSSKKRSDKEERFFCVVDRSGKYQVFRYVYIQRSNRKESFAHYFIDEVMQKWMSDDEVVTIVAKGRLINQWSFDGWSHSTKMEIRERGCHYNSFNYEVSVHKTYPAQKWKSEYKKYGINRQIDRADPYWLLREVRHDPKAETLLKAKQYGLLAYMTNADSSFVRINWSTIKICMRNKYTVKDASIYADYIHLLERYHKDLRNAFYVCPKDLIKAHDTYVLRRKKEQEKAEKERKEKELLRQKESEAKFIERISRFLDLLITDGKIVIVPLKSLEEFKAESDVMHHCVFSCEYWKKVNVLVLSARIGEKRIETIEFSLKTFKVVQSRGVQNQNTEYHDRIINLVNMNIGLIKQRLTA